jgi:hypothetical protein
MIEIVERLYLGNRESARDLRRLRAAGITHVVNCTCELPNYHEGELIYLTLGLLDPDVNFRTRLPGVCTFIDDARKEGRVLVHCFAAHSRAPSVVLAYLCHLGDTLEQAARRLGAIAWCDPDLLHLRQIAEHRGEELPEGGLERLSRLLQGRRWEDREA